MQQPDALPCLARTSLFAGHPSCLSVLPCLLSPGVPSTQYPVPSQLEGNNMPRLPTTECCSLFPSRAVTHSVFLPAVRLPNLAGAIFLSPPPLPLSLSSLSPSPFFPSAYLVDLNSKASNRLLVVWHPSFLIWALLLVVLSPFRLRYSLGPCATERAQRPSPVARRRSAHRAAFFSLAHARASCPGPRTLRSVRLPGLRISSPTSITARKNSSIPLSSTETRIRSLCAGLCRSFIQVGRPFSSFSDTLPTPSPQRRPSPAAHRLLCW